MSRRSLGLTSPRREHMSSRDYSSVNGFVQGNCKTVELYRKHQKIHASYHQIQGVAAAFFPLQTILQTSGGSMPLSVAQLWPLDCPLAVVEAHPQGFVGFGSMVMLFKIAHFHLHGLF